jgi:outer membrane protein assembly factor BamA
LILIASGPTLSGQQTAQDSTKTKDVNVEPQDEGRLRGIARRVESITSSEDKEGVSVTAGIIVAGSSLAGGVGYRRLNFFRNIGAELEGSVSLRRYQDYRAAIGLLEHRRSSVEFDAADDKVTSLFNTTSHKSPGSALFADLRYRDYPRHSYYGTGINTLADDKSDYALRGGSVEGVWQWQMSPTLGLSARGGWLGLDVDPGSNDAIVNLEERFAISTIPGAPDQPHFVTYGLGVVHDSRSEPGAPEDGEMAGISLRRFSASDRQAAFAPGASAPRDLSFTRLTLDARGYRQVFSPRGVFAVRGLVSTDLAGDTGATPFYLQQALGGGETLRGFHSYRFADRALAHVSVEYRWRAHRYVEIAPFLDTGTVAPSLSRLSLGALKMSPGVGIRARTNRRAIARLDWAWGSEGQRVALGMGPAF